MMIEVCGVSTRNKGAELMLIAIQEHFQQCAPDISLAVTPEFGTFAERGSYGLWQLARPGRLGRSALAVALMPHSFRQAFGLVLESELDVILDASGFAFGDQHPLRRVERFAADVSRWRSQGKQIVLLPQAFGPFQSTAHRQSFEIVLANVDLVFARDPISLKHLQQFSSVGSKICLAPDFTNLVRGVLPASFASTARSVCIVPNYRMIDKTDPVERMHYIPFLATCIRESIRRGLHPFLLLHDADVDEKLVAPLQEHLAEPLQVIRERNPVTLKGILGSVELVIGSRFHALISALSQAVPCIATGWSHKYQMLLEDYGCPECILSTTASADQVGEMIVHTTSEPERSALLARLRQCGSVLVRATRQMWSEVDTLLGIRQVTSAHLAPLLTGPSDGSLG